MCYSQHISPGNRKQCATLVPQPANMPRINWVASDRVQQAVAFSIKCPNATIPQCMLACGFSKAEMAILTMSRIAYADLYEIFNFI